MDFNYYALAIAILANCIPETAFEKLQSDKPSLVKNQLTSEDFDDMVKLRRAGLTYKGLEEIYHMNSSAIWNMLKRTGRMVYLDK